MEQASTSGRRQVIPPLVLASTSSARQHLLRQAGLPFEALAPEVEEYLDAGGDAATQAMGLARLKALAVATRRPEAIVIGADQVLNVDGLVLGKPVDAAAARAQLARLSGRQHALVTGLCVVSPQGLVQVTSERTTMTVRALRDEELDAYVATGEWRGCAGSYRVEGQGIGLFERLDGDWTNVLGLPMPALLTILRGLGVPLFRGVE